MSRDLKKPIREITSNLESSLTTLLEKVPYKPRWVHVHREGVYLLFEQDGKEEDLEVICLPDARVKVMGVFTEIVDAVEAIELINQWHTQKKPRLEEEDKESSECCTEDVQDGLTELIGKVCSTAMELRKLVEAPPVHESVRRSGLAFEFKIGPMASAEAVCQCDGTVLVVVKTETNRCVHQKQANGCSPSQAAQLINELLPKTPKLDLE